MTLHANALLLIIDEVSDKNKSLPIILCGDFNMELYSSTYDLVVGEKIDTDLPYLGWKPDIFKRKFIDTREYKEGDYTTHNVLPDGRIFKEVLDYIFISDFHCIENKIHWELSNEETKTDDFVPNKDNGSDHFLIKAILSFKDYIECYIWINNDYRSGPSMRIQNEEENGDYDTSIKLYYNSGKFVTFFYIDNDEILSIPYNTIEEGKKIMNQIYAKCNGFLPFVVTGMTPTYKEEGYYPEIGHVLDGAPEGVLEHEFNDSWCFCLMTNDIEIEGSLIVRPYS